MGLNPGQKCSNLPLRPWAYKRGDRAIKLKSAREPVFFLLKENSSAGTSVLDTEKVVKPLMIAIFARYFEYKRANKPKKYNFFHTNVFKWG